MDIISESYIDLVFTLEDATLHPASDNYKAACEQEVIRNAMIIARHYDNLLSIQKHRVKELHNQYLKSLTRYILDVETLNEKRRQLLRICDDVYIKNEYEAQKKALDKLKVIREKFLKKKRLFSLKTTIQCFCI